MPLAARLAVAAAYLAFICFWAWAGGESDDTESSVPIVLGVALWLAWIGGSVLVGTSLGPWAFALPVAMSVAACVVWQRVDWFSADFAAVNAIAQGLIECVLIAPGVWLRRRRARRRAAPWPAEPVYSSPAGRRRSRLRWAWRRLACSRRTRLARLGAVGRRARGTCSARSRRSRRRCSASSRLRAWLRSSWATARTTGPQRASTRARWASVSDGEAAASKTASTREAVTFACWPPGPDERLARTTISRSGIATSRVTRIGSSIAPLAAGG